jgi:hypothetical protein
MPGKLGQTTLIVFAEFPKVSLRKRNMLRPFQRQHRSHHKAWLRCVRTMVRLVGNKDLADSCGRLRSVQVPGVLANGRYDPLRGLFVSI